MALAHVKPSKLELNVANSPYKTVLVERLQNQADATFYLQRLNNTSSLCRDDMTWSLVALDVHVLILIHPSKCYQFINLVPCS